MIIGSFIVLNAVFAPVAFAQDAPTYLEAVLKRADDGLQFVDAEKSDVTYFDLARPEWLAIVFSTASAVTDTDLRVERASRDLQENTACMHASVAIVDRKIDDVMTRLKQAEQEKDVQAIFQLKDLIDFLQRSEDILLDDSATPDTQWPTLQRFDRPPDTGYCCVPGNKDPLQNSEEECDGKSGTFSYNPYDLQAKGCTVPSDAARMCSFDSDTLPPSISGYGCDATAMDRLLPLAGNASPEIYNSLLQARQSIASIETAAQTYQAEAQAYAAVQQSIESIVNGQPPPAAPPADPGRTHKRVYGCEDPSCATHPELCTASKDMIVHELRGSFSIEPDQIRIVSDFGRQWESEGANRKTGSGLEIDPNRPGITATVQQYAQGVFRAFSRSQEDDAARIFATTADPVLSANDTLLPLRQSVERLARLIRTDNGQIGGLRGFVRDFAYFLRRSCLERPCNERLDRVLKITFTENCFPYTDGRYTSIDAQQSCLTGAKLNCPPYVKAETLTPQQKQICEDEAKK